MPIDLVAGWTEAIEYTLNANGATLNLTGMDVEIVVRDVRGNIVPVTGVVVATDSVNGLVSYYPSEQDTVLLAPGTYVVRFKVTDTQGKVIFCPHAAPEKWIIRQ